MDELKSGRILLVDSLRGLAIVLMLVDSAPKYLMHGTSNSLPYSYAYVVSRLSVPLFLFLAGYCVVLSGRRRIASSGNLDFLRHVLWRWVVLFAWGCFVEFLRMDVFQFNVLHAIGFMVFSAGLIYSMGSGLVYSLILLLLFSVSFANPIVLQNYFVSVFGFFGWFMFSGDFPNLYWLVYSVLGLGFGWFASKVVLDWTKAYWLWVSFLLLSSLTGVLGYSIDTGWNTPPFLFLALGHLAVVYVLLSWLCSHNKLIFIPRLLSVYGRHSLALYVAHQLVFVTLPRLFGFVGTLDSISVIAVFVLFLILSLAVMRAKEKKTA